MEGQSGPKARSKGVVDGKQVNIPVLDFNLVKRDGEGGNQLDIGILVEVLNSQKNEKKLSLENIRPNWDYIIYRSGLVLVILPRKAFIIFKLNQPVP